MTCNVLIVGLPSAAGCPSDKTWRAAGTFVAHRLRACFGAEVDCEYAELFTADMARHPGVEATVARGDATPPIVLIDGGLAFSGGKLNVSAIERAVAAALNNDASAIAGPEAEPAAAHYAHEVRQSPLRRTQRANADG